MELNLEDSYVGVESRDTLERRNYHVWQKTSGLFSGSYYTLDFVSSQGDASGRLFTESPNRKRASMPRPERMVQSAPTFDISPSEKQTLNLIANHPMIPREHLARWLGVSEGRVSQMMLSLVDTWGLIERRGKRGDTRYTLSAEGHTLRHAQGPRPAPDDAGHLEHRPHDRPSGPDTARGPPHRHVGAADEARRRDHMVPIKA